MRKKTQMLTNENEDIQNVFNHSKFRSINLNALNREINRDNKTTMNIMKKKRPFKP